MASPSSSSSSSSSSFSHSATSCFHYWLSQQQSDLDDLLQVLSTATSTNDDTPLPPLIAKILKNFESYSAHRRSLVPQNPPGLFSPAWCSSFENTFLWIGGCRPTLSVRLVYTQSSTELTTHIDDFLAAGLDITGAGGMLGISPDQFNLIQDLHQRTLKEEERMSAAMAQLQEDIMLHYPLQPIVMQGGGAEVTAVMEPYVEKLGKLLEEADELRIRTLKEMVTEILTPRQAVEILAAGKQLHLAIHQWGRNRDTDTDAEKAQG